MPPENFESDRNTGVLASAAVSVPDVLTVMSAVPSVLGCRFRSRAKLELEVVSSENVIRANAGGRSGLSKK